MKQQRTFLQIDYTLLPCTHWVSLTTGETLPLSMEQKVMWSYFQSRYNHFKLKLGGEWFDNQDAMASVLGVSRITVNRFLQALSTHGYVQITKPSDKRRGFRESNNYTILSDLKTIAPKEKALPSSGKENRADVVQISEDIVQDIPKEVKDSLNPSSADNIQDVPVVLEAAPIIVNRQEVPKTTAKQGSKSSGSIKAIPTPWDAPVEGKQAPVPAKLAGFMPVGPITGLHSPILAKPALSNEQPTAEDIEAFKEALEDPFPIAGVIASFEAKWPRPAAAIRNSLAN